MTMAPYLCSTGVQGHCTESNDDDKCVSNVFLALLDSIQYVSSQKQNFFSIVKKHLFRGIFNFHIKVCNAQILVHLRQMLA